MKKIKKLLKKQGFTLVELIIVIAIIAVLAVAAFMMLTKWLGHSRDARKIGDVATIKKALNIAFVEKPIYPEPEDKNPIKDLDGNVLWYQGVFGASSSSEIDTLQKAPVNPTDDSYYIYSVTTDQKEYQIGVWLENGEEVSFTNSVFAVEGFARIEGEYDGYVTYSSGADGKIIKIPSLILTDGDTIDLSGSNSNLMLEGKGEGEPLEVNHVSFNPENVDNDKLISDIKTIFGMEDDKAAMLIIEDNSSITPSAISYEGCTTNHGDSISHGASLTKYENPTEPYGGTCVSETHTCENGSIDDFTYTNTSCSVEGASYCTANTHDGYDYNDIIYGGTQEVSKSVPLTEGHGTTDYSATLTCNEGTIEKSGETSSINCDDGYTERGGSCILESAGSCKEIYDDNNSVTDGNYTIDPDGDGPNAPLEVYCDMTNGGWTRYAYIKGNWAKGDGINCIKGTIISNSTLECFNPNRFGMDAAEIKIKQGATTREKTLNVTASYTTLTKYPGYEYYCTGNSEYMVLMSETGYPSTDATDVPWLRLGLNFCKYNREVGGRGNSPYYYMNYSQTGHGPAPQDRSSNAIVSELFIR